MHHRQVAFVFGMISGPKSGIRDRSCIGIIRGPVYPCPGFQAMFEFHRVYRFPPFFLTPMFAVTRTTLGLRLSWYLCPAMNER